MNNERAKNTYLSTIAFKQTKQRRRTETDHGHRECFDGCLPREGCGRMGEEVRGLRSTNRWLQNSPGDVKYSTGNGEAEELIHKTLDMNNGVWMG